MRRALLLLASMVFAAGCNQEDYEDPYAECVGKGGDCGPTPDPPVPAPQPDGCKGEDVTKQSMHDRILNCKPCSPDYAFTLSGVDVCRVPEQPVYDPPQPTPTPAAAPAIDLAKFAAYMQQLNGQTVGYAWALVDTKAGAPRLAISGASGFADMNTYVTGSVGTPFTPGTLANVGSSTKVLGGVSLLYAFEHLGAQKNPNAIGLDRFLATPFLYFLPRTAKIKAHPSLATITIAELLQHRSGLRVGTSDTPEIDLRNLLLEEVTPVEKVVREYSNMGMLVTRHLITFLSDPSKREALEEDPSITIDELSAKLDKVTRGYYADFLATTMKTAVGDDFTSTCFAAETPGAARMFDNTVSRKSYIYSSKAWGGCSTQGGQWSSVDDWAKFFVAYENDKLVSAHARHLMSNRDEFMGLPGEGRLIWSNFNSVPGGTHSPWLKTNHGIATLFGHGGDHSKADPNANDGIEYHAHAAVLQLLWGYYGVAIVNSSELGSTDLMVRLRDAFASSLGWTAK